MKKKKLLAIIGALMIGTMLFGCGKSDNTGVDNKNQDIVDTITDSDEDKEVDGEASTEVNNIDDGEKEASATSTTIDEDGRLVPVMFNSSFDIFNAFMGNSMAFDKHEKIGDAQNVTMDDIKVFANRHNDLVDSFVSADDKAQRVYALVCIDDLEHGVDDTVKKELYTYVFDNYDKIDSMENFYEFYYMTCLVTRLLEVDPTFADYEEFTSNLFSMANYSVYVKYADEKSVDEYRGKFETSKALVDAKIDEVKGLIN